MNDIDIGRVPQVPVPLNDCDKHGKQILMAAPNQDNDGGGYVCKVNEDCKTVHAEYWDCHGRKVKKLSYCPPQGFPPKLDPEDGLLTQCVQGRANKAKEAKERKKLKEKLGKKEWKKYERARKNAEIQFRKEEKAMKLAERRRIREEKKKRLREKKEQRQIGEQVGNHG